MPASDSPGAAPPRPARRPRWSRPLRIAVGVVAVAVLMVALAAGAAVWLVSSGGGARLVLDRLDSVIPGELAVGRVEGALRGPLHIEDLVYAREGMRLTIGDLRLSWDLRDLLRRQLDIHSLAASEVRVEMTPAEDSGEPFALPQVELPVNVVVREASLRDAVIAVGESEPIVVRSAALATSTQGDTVVIDSFDLDSPDIALEVSGSLTPLGAYAVDLVAAWAFHAPDGRTYRGEGSFEGTLEDLAIDQRLVEPFAARVRARLLDPLDDLRFEGDVEAARVVLAELDPEWPRAEIAAAKVRVEGSLDDLRARGEVVASTADYGRLAADFDVRGGGESWRIDELRLRTAGAGPRSAADGAVVASGDLTLGATPRFDLEARWDGLQWPLATAVVGASAETAPNEQAAEAMVLAPSGAVAIQGTVDAYRLKGTARLGLPGLLAPAASRPATAGPETARPATTRPATATRAAVPAPAGAGERRTLWVDAELAASGDRRHLEIDRVGASILGGRLSGEGTVSWQPRVAWRLALDGDDLRPGEIDPRLDGSLDLAVSTEGTMEESGPRGHAVLRSVEGAMGGGRVLGAGRIDLLGDAYRVSDLAVRWGDARLDAAGTLGAPSPGTLDLRFRLGAPDLASLVPELAGSLDAQGTLTGTRQSPALDARIEGSGVVMGELAVDRLIATARVGAGAQDPLEIALDATAPRFGEYRFASARIRASGSRAEHTLESRWIDGVRPLESLEVVARGGLVGSEWRGEARRVVFAPDGEQIWTLVAPAPVIAGASRIELGQLCLRSQASTLCAAADWRGAEDWKLDASARQVALDRVVGLFRDDVAISGVVDGTMAVAAAGGGRVRATADLTSERGSFELPLEGQGGAEGPGAGGEVAGAESPGVRQWRNARLRLVAGGEGTRAEAAVDLPDIGRAEGWLELPGWSTPGMPPSTQPVRGSLDAVASSLEPLGLVSTALARPRGRIDADLEIAGTVGAPRVSGAAMLRDGSAFVVPLGIDVTELELTATPDDSGQLVLAGSLESGGGVLTIRGTAPLDPEDAWVRIEASGEDVLVMDLPDRHIVASTRELGLEWAGDGLTATGEVTIPEAHLLLDEDSPDAVSASPDVVFVRLPAGDTREAGSELPLRARVRILLGEEVTVTGFGLEAEVRGSVLVIEEPGSVTRATGELDLSGGTFRAYGQKLELERGRLIFAQSPVTSPALDLRASRRTGDVVAGIDARGTLDHPRVELWSDPTLPQAEQLSYLLLGRPLDDASPQDGDVLTSAARALGLRGGRYLATRLGSELGLEEARLDTEGGFEQASLVLGKFLSPRLYVSYGVALFDGANALLIRYLLSDKLTLEATTGENNSADVLYVIESGPGEARPDLQPGIPRTRDERTRRKSGNGESRR